MKWYIYSADILGLVGSMATVKRLSPDGYFIQPMMNAKGDNIVFWGNETGETGFNIWSCRPDGTMRRKLTDDRGINGHPFLSADGKQMLFFSSRGVSDETEFSMVTQFDLNRAPRNLWIMDADGSHPRQLTEGPYVDERPCLSPDGNEVVFVSNRSGHPNLWSLDMAGRNLRQVTNHTGLDYRPIFSPDGKTLAFFSDQNPRKVHDLCLMNWPGGDIRWPVAPGRFKWIHGAFWLNDGDTILFHAVAADEDACALWAFRLSTGAIDRLVLAGFPMYAHGTLDRSETKIAFDSKFAFFPA